MSSYVRHLLLFYTGFTMTRRDLMIATPAALLAQAPQTIPQTAEEELSAAHEQLHRASEQLSKVAVPISTEPATHFKA